MTVTIGLVLVAALGCAAYPTVRRRHVRLRTVRHVRASVAPWLTSDMAAPLRPALAPSVDGYDTAEPWVLPRAHGSAVLKRQHFELTTYEIEHHRRAS